MGCSWTALWRRMAKHRHGYIPNPCCSDFVCEKRALGEWRIILWVACFVNEIACWSTTSSKSTRFRCILFSVWWLRECACSIQKCIYYLTIHPNEEEKHISSHQLIKHGKSQINTTSNSFLSKQNRNHLQSPHLIAACVSIAFNPFSSFSDADSSSSWSFGATTTLLSFHLAILFLSLSQIGFHCPARRAIANDEMSRHDPYSCFYRAGKQGIIVFWGEKSL